MTDNEFIRALRTVAKKYEGKPVATCETNISNMATDAADRIERLCDEIKRQKAEIERLIDLVYDLGDDNEAWVKDNHDLQVELNTAKAEAIREFADRLKLYLFIERGGISTVSGKDIDNLIKEMTEEKQ